MDPTLFIKSCDTPFSIPTYRYAFTLMRVWIRRNWYWAFALPVALSLFAAVTLSLRYLLIAVVLVFLVCPHIILWVYYYHAMSPESRMSILPHTMNVDHKGIKITYVPDDDDDDDKRKLPPPDFIEASRISDIRCVDDYLIVKLDSNSYRLVIFPIHFPEK